MFSKAIKEAEAASQTPSPKTQNPFQNGISSTNITPFGTGSSKKLKMVSHLSENILNNMIQQTMRGI